LLAESRPGEASPAAAGMLAPSVERATGAAHDFAIAARDRYPSYVKLLAERTGITVPLNRLGILQVATSEKGIKGLRKTALPSTRWLDARELREIEPSLSHALGAMLNPDDGSVDNTILLTALNRLCDASDRIVRTVAAVTGIAAANDSCTVVTATGERRTARRVVIAAGAWAGQIGGARFAQRVEPARGQLVSYGSAPLNHVAYGPRGYIVPRGATTIGGSTMENAGFVSETTDAGEASETPEVEETNEAPAAEADDAGETETEPASADAGADPDTEDQG